MPTWRSAIADFSHQRTHSVRPRAVESHGVGFGVIMRLTRWRRHGSGDDTRPVSAGVEVLMNRLACVALGLLVVLPVSAGAQGQKVFEAQKCSLCHSVAGKGNTKGALDDVGSKYSAADLKLWLT